jgi:hypothetical protein
MHVPDARFEVRAECALLGRLPDAEIARRAGVNATTVLGARRKLGIPARQSRREVGCCLRGECQPH